MHSLRRVNCSSPGIRRRRVGRGFTYVDSLGQRVDDPEVLDRIRALAIPPAWTDVWICTDPYGHIQAMGTDARGRRQYRYHDVWRQRRDLEKFDHMLLFARALPPLRDIVRADLRSDELSRRRVLACAIRLLDVGAFRIGSETYASENKTFGLATLERRHVRLSGPELVFDYTAKGGQRRIQTVTDSDVVRVVQEIKRHRQGPRELLAWREGRSWIDVRSSDINSYLKTISGGSFSAKDFRTWNATVLAAVALAVAPPAATDAARRRQVVAAIREVSTFLGNTPAVCRKSYIDPRVVDNYHGGITIAERLEDFRPLAELEMGQERHGPIELAVLELLDGAEEFDRAA